MPTESEQRRRAINYGRISAVGGDGTSVDSQLAAGRQVAAREGWEIVNEYRDDGISASRYARGKARPGWQDVMAGIAGTLHRGDVLIVWEISRASRDRTVSAALLAACSESHVYISVGGKLHDPNDPDDAFMLDLGAALAVRESSMTSKRVQRLVNERANTGRPNGRLAYGYRATYDPRSGKPAGQVPDPDTAPIVREIADRVLAGEGLYSIVADLNARGVPSPTTVTRLRNHYPTVETPWTPQQVRRVATSSTAAGIRVYQGRPLPDVEVQWEPIVDRSEHARILELSRARALRGANDGNRARHLLTHIATCGVCGADLLARTNHTTPAYSCPAGHVSRSRAQLDELVTRQVIYHLLDSGLSAALYAADSDERASMASARSELADLRAELEGWYEAAAEGTVSPVGLGRVEKRLLERIAGAEQRCRPRRPPPSDSAVAGLLLDDDVPARWGQAEVGYRRQVIRELIETLRVHRTSRGRRILDVNTVEIVWRV